MENGTEASELWHRPDMLAPDSCFDPRLPFTTAQARRAGLTRHQLAGPGYQQLLRGVHISSRVVVQPPLRTQAALLVHPPGAVASHSSAARLLGVPVPHDPDEHVTVSKAEDRRARRGLRCHVASLAETDVAAVRGLRVTAPHRLFVDLAGALGLVDLVVVGDWLVRHGHATTESLQTYCAGSAARHARAAAHAAQFVRPRVDSPMETRLRMLLVLAGLPEPQVNLEIRGEDGLVVLRLDLSYPELRLAVEYDGRHHATRENQWERDLERREFMDGTEWRLLVVTAKGIYREPERTVHRVWEALKERGCPGLAAPTDGWRPHFGR